MIELKRVFTLLVDAKPTLAFEARNTRQAQEICRERWLRSDLLALKSNDTPLSTGRSHLSVRKANQDEASVFAKAAAEATAESDDLVLAYLIELDDAGLPDGSK